MKGSVPVLDVLFPSVRATMLRLLFCSPPRQRYVRELMAITGLAMHTIQDELRKLTAIGLVVSWSNGYHRFYRAHQENALFEHLHQIVQLSEKLPTAKHSVLNRPAEGLTRRKRMKTPIAKMRPSRPPGWDLFKDKRTAF